MKQRYVLLAIGMIALWSACRKKEAEDIAKPEIKAERKGLYVLAEGLFNANNSSLTYYDFESKALIPDQFKAVNNRGLGDTGNDIKIYGSKMYVIVNVSSTLEILNSTTASSIKKIDLKNGSVGRQPRYIVFDKNKAFISNFDGTVAVLDTATMAIEKYIPVGRNPEMMAIANGKLYVANSGGLDYPNYDKTVSVIDLNTLTESKKISVVDNPRGVFADNYGDIYILSTGNYDNIKAAMTIIDSKTDQIKAQANFSAGSVAVSGDYAYFTASGGIVKVFDTKMDPLVNGVFQMEKSNFITDGTKITTAYGINIDELSGEVFISDAKSYTVNGEIFCFDKEGKKKYSLTVGINPNNVVFINK